MAAPSRMMSFSAPSEPLRGCVRGASCGVNSRQPCRSFGPVQAAAIDLSSRWRGPSAGRPLRGANPMPIVNRIADLHGDITAWRRDLHAHPELLYDVHRTAGTVADKLKSFGCDEVVTGIGRTGVVGVIHGHRTDATSQRRTIGLRADMDALPIAEETNVPYQSTVPGKMHACGHDGHTAMLLGAAKYLAETRNFAGTAVVIFQPAEEGGGGGRAM